MKYIIIIVLTFLVGKAQCQINKGDLKGKWTMCNENDLYNTADTIILYQDINYQYSVKGCCHFINWIIKSKNIEIENLFACSEPGRVTKRNGKQTIKLIKANHDQIIVVCENGKKLSKFKVIRIEASSINRYPYDIKTLTLKRDSLLD
jgi:hypothetical protein